MKNIGWLIVSKIFENSDWLDSIYNELKKS